MDDNDTLVVIPARKGSKGIPGKNKKKLNNKPLIAYSIEAAIELYPKEHICISTNDKEIVEIAESYGLKVPFLRPELLSTDTIGSQEVLVHAYEFYKEIGFEAKTVLLLQATSPFRTAKHIVEAANLFDSNSDMLVSVVESKSNPYFNLLEENANGYLVKSKEGIFKTRQDMPKVFEINGAIYFINSNSLLSKPISEFSRISKYVMNKLDSIDIDTPLDWKYAELLMSEREDSIN